MDYKIKENINVQDLRDLLRDETIKEALTNIILEALDQREKKRAMESVESFKKTVDYRFQ